MKTYAVVTINCGILDDVDVFEEEGMAMRHFFKLVDEYGGWDSGDLEVCDKSGYWTDKRLEIEIIVRIAKLYNS